MEVYKDGLMVEVEGMRMWLQVVGQPKTPCGLVGGLR